VLACQIDIPLTITAADRDRHLHRLAGEITSQVRQFSANHFHHTTHHGGTNDSFTADSHTGNTAGNTTGNNIDLIVLPELASMDYSREAFEQLALLAEPLQGPSAECWARVAIDCNCHIAYGFARKVKTGYTISVAVVSPDGSLVGHYDKMHLAQYGASMEKEYFQRGNQVFVFNIGDLRLAPIICYDIRFPELCRSLALQHRVDAILHCGAYYRDESFDTWHDFVRTRALENQLYFLSLNRAGKHYGHSVFCPPWVDNNRPHTTFDVHREEFRVFSIDRQTILQARETYSFLHDRLESY
jgi:nitrilase